MSELARGVYQPTSLPTYQPTSLPTYQSTSLWMAVVEGEPGRLIRLEEVASHDISHGEERSVWTVIHDKVYDITGLLGEHPGGDEPLVAEAAGKDCTEQYEDTWPSRDNRELLEGFYIGELDPRDRTGKVVKERDFDGRERPRAGSGVQCTIQ